MENNTTVERKSERELAVTRSSMVRRASCSKRGPSPIRSGKCEGAGDAPAPPRRQRHLAGGGAFDGVDHRRRAGEDGGVLGDRAGAQPEDEHVAGLRVARCDRRADAAPPRPASFRCRSPRPSRDCRAAAPRHRSRRARATPRARGRGNRRRRRARSPGDDRACRASPAPPARRRRLRCAQHSLSVACDSACEPLHPSA